MNGPGRVSYIDIAIEIWRANKRARVEFTSRDMSWNSGTFPIEKPKPDFS